MLTNYNGTAITYDAIGNPLKWRNAAAIEWQGRNLTLFSNSNGEIYNYAYNADGIRTQKNIFNASGDYVGTTEYIYDGTKLIAESRSGDWLYYFYDASGAISGMSYNGTMYYFRKNLQGDVTGIYNATGTLVVEYEYTPYGALLSTTGSMATTIGTINPIRYRGYYYDTETELYYLITRYYDPIVGRFLNADAIIGANGGIIGCNLFAYCNNNPINYADHSGMFFDDVLGTIIEGLLEFFVQQLEKLANSMKASYNSGTLTIKGGGVYVSVSNQLYDSICSKADTLARNAKYGKAATKLLSRAGVLIECILSIYDNIANEELSTQRIITDSIVDVGFSIGTAAAASYAGGKFGTMICPGWGTVIGMGVGLLGAAIVEYTPVDEWVKDGLDYVVDGIGSAINSLGEWTGWW